MQDVGEGSQPQLQLHCGSPCVLHEHEQSCQKAQTVVAEHLPPEHVALQLSKVAVLNAIAVCDVVANTAVATNTAVAHRLRIFVRIWDLRRVMS